MLASNELAKVIAKLQVPLVVADLLPYPEALTGDEEYGLHEAISEMQPDAALLSIALSAGKIASVHAGTSQVFQFVAMECSRIVEEYAPLWLSHAENGAVDQDAVFETLSHTPDDLRDLAELLEMAVVLLEKAVPKAAVLCNVLAVQARAQSMVADAYVSALEDTRVTEPVPAGVMIGNVVPFKQKSA